MTPQALLNTFFFFFFFCPHHLSVERSYNSNHACCLDRKRREITLAMERMFLLYSLFFCCFCFILFSFFFCYNRKISVVIVLLYNFIYIFFKHKQMIILLCLLKEKKKNFFNSLNQFSSLYIPYRYTNSYPAFHSKKNHFNFYNNIKISIFNIFLLRLTGYLRYQKWTMNEILILFTIVSTHFPFWFGVKLLHDIFFFFFFFFLMSLNHTWLSRLGLQNTLTASLQRGKTLPMNVLNMTLNHLMVKFQELSGIRSTPSLPSLPGPL